MLALHNDPLSNLQTELSDAQASGDGAREAELAQRLADEHSKRERWAVCFFPPLIAFFISYDLPQFENSLRRHNYVGMIHSLALALARSGRLDAATDGARTAMRKRIEERRNKRQPMDED